MKIYKELSLKNFKAWSGAVDTLDILIRENRVEDVENYIEEMQACGQEFSETGINDFLWFETEFIFLNLLGYTEEEMNELY